MIRINEIKLPLDAAAEQSLYPAAAKALKIDRKRIQSLEVVRKSIDSRKKEEGVFFVYSVDVSLDRGEEELLARQKGPRVQPSEPYRYEPPRAARNSQLRPVVVGLGPAGLFAALTLARAGYRPLVLERGRDVDTRTQDVKDFWRTRTLDESSNVQFGEGGAGTFSDGKLTTGIKDVRCRKVFLEFVSHGAPQAILYDAKPHIGTDRLGAVVKSMREEIVSLGGTVLFSSRLLRVIAANGAVHGITYRDAQGSEVDFETDAVILAIGHSARDTVEALYRQGIQMMQKPFSIGARIEHPQELIDRVQYGRFAGHPALGAADYKLACHPPHGRGMYTFCMCPGGTVVCAASEQGGVVVNGMSEWARDGENANSAILVGIEPAYFSSDHPLAGMHDQRKIEQAAFRLGGGDYTAPAQLVGDFLADRPSHELGAVRPTCPTGVLLGDIAQVLPARVIEVMRAALVQMDQKLKGFALPDSVLTAPETRSSSPVRILRDEFLQSNLRGLYPCGEGAGYAGGIVSAAVDGIRCAEMVLRDEQ